MHGSESHKHAFAHKQRLHTCESAAPTASIEPSVGCHSTDVTASLCHLKCAIGVLSFRLRRSQILPIEREIEGL